MTIAPGAPSGIILRPARAEDGVRCQQIAVAAWEPIYASHRQLLGEVIFAHLYPRWQERKAGQIAAAFLRHLEWILVACAEDAAPAPGDQGATAAGSGLLVVGFATYRLDAATRVGEIGNNAVDPAWQGRGIATALCRRVLGVFRAQGIVVARVTTGLDPAHAPAVATYRKVGFTAEVPSVTLYQALGRQLSASPARTG